MSVLASANEFLPTNNEPLFNILGVSIFIGVVAVVFAAVCLILKKAPTPRYAVPVMVPLMILTIVAPSMGLMTHINNSKNLKANIEKAYDFDDVYVWQYAASLLNKGQPATATVTKDGKTTSMRVTQDDETFEPTLSKIPEPPTDDEIDEWLEKK